LPWSLPEELQALERRSLAPQRTLTTSVLGKRTRGKTSSAAALIKGTFSLHDVPLAAISTAENH